jgi:osmotically-inducible protein OsmY
MNDKTLRKDVIDELDFEPSVDAADIAVTVDNGIVSLSGQVSSYMQKLAAEAAAWRVRGVKAVTTGIHVRPFPTGMSDTDIAARAVQALALDATLPANALRVTVQNGAVTLRGELPWQYQREHAERAVRHLAGVTTVNDLITLRPMVQPTEVKQRIENALKRHASVEAARIRVLTADGEVTLEGEVDNWEERVAVEQAAWSAPGVRKVQDRLAIST